jgi:hypothetical protein
LLTHHLYNLARNHSIFNPHTAALKTPDHVAKMSEPIPESIPTSSDRKSHRPTKKRALTPLSQQSQQVEALFANPDREITLPSGPKAKTAPLPPEIVANVQGSSAGAGSGEFHVYKASRRREYERLRLMDEEVEREEKQRAWLAKQEELKTRDEEKLSRNQAKRAKLKARKERAELARKGGVMDVDAAGEGDGGKKADGMGVKKKLGAAKVALPVNGDKDEDAARGDAATSGNREAENGGGITFVDDD